MSLESNVGNGERKRREIERVVAQSFIKEDSIIGKILPEEDYLDYTRLSARGLTKDKMTKEDLLKLIGYFREIRESERFNDITPENKRRYGILVYKVIDHYLIQDPTQ